MEGQSLIDFLQVYSYITLNRNPSHFHESRDSVVDHRGGGRGERGSTWRPKCKDGLIPNSQFCFRCGAAWTVWLLRSYPTVGLLGSNSKLFSTYFGFNAFDSSWYSLHFSPSSQVPRKQHHFVQLNWFQIWKATSKMATFNLIVACILCSVDGFGVNGGRFVVIDGAGVIYGGYHINEG